MNRQLFDNMAESFDQHLVTELGYRLPRVVADKILWRDSLERTLNVLDLGCGTGLLGACLGFYFDGFLIGVELSSKMIEQAARHDVYDRFHTVNLLDALRETPASIYEVITAMDVFVYVGDISTLFPMPTASCCPLAISIFPAKPHRKKARSALTRQRPLCPQTQPCTTAVQAGGVRERIDRNRVLFIYQTKPFRAQSGANAMF